MRDARDIRNLSLAGRIILENGGETYRAEDTVTRMALALGYAQADVFAVPSGLFITVTDENGGTETDVCRVHARGTMLCRVDRVNAVSRMLAEGRLSPEELPSALEEARCLGQDAPDWFAPLWAGVSSAGFAVLFGGSAADVLIAAVCGALTQILNLPMLHRHGEDPFGGAFSAILGSLLCTLLPLLFHALTGLGHTDAMIAGALMPLVPGLSMTNAVRDILRGDLLSGVTHAARALMTAAVIAGGGLVGIHLFGLTGLPMPQAGTVSLPSGWMIPVFFAGAAVVSAAFGALLYGPCPEGFRRFLRASLYSALLGGGVYVLYTLLHLAGLSQSTSMFFGALAGAAGAMLAAKRLRMIATVFVTNAILPLVPGLGLYRATEALANGQNGAGVTLAVQSMTQILMIALGIAVVHLLQQRRRRGTPADDA